MRAIAPIAFALATTLLTASAGYAQSEATPPDSAKAQTKNSSENSFWPSPEQESAIPYHPCNTDVELQNGRHACLNNGY